MTVVRIAIAIRIRFGLVVASLIDLASVTQEVDQGACHDRNGYNLFNYKYLSILLNHTKRPHSEHRANFIRYSAGQLENSSASKEWGGGGDPFRGEDKAVRDAEVPLARARRMTTLSPTGRFHRESRHLPG
jgi:hypothetical protein